MQANAGLFFFFNFDTSMGIWTDFLLHVGKKGEEMETLELFAGWNKPSGASRESTETPQNSVWEENLVIGQRNVRKSWVKCNKIQRTGFKPVTSWEVFASIVKHISSNMPAYEEGGHSSYNDFQHYNVLPLTHLANTLSPYKG